MTCGMEEIVGDEVARVFGELILRQECDATENERGAHGSERHTTYDLQCRVQALERDTDAKRDLSDILPLLHKTETPRPGSSPAPSSPLPSSLVNRPGHGFRQRSCHGFLAPSSWRGGIRSTPPRIESSFMCRLGRFTEAWHHELRTRLRAQLQQRLRRLVPGMHRESERSPVNGQKLTAAEQCQCLERVVRPEVHIAPGRMECPHFQHYQVERPKPFADCLIFSREACVTAEKHRMPL